MQPSRRGHLAITVLASALVALCAGCGSKDGGTKPAPDVGWTPLASGTDSTVLALQIWKGDLIAGGLFTHAGDSVATGIARWHDGAWNGVGDGVDPADVLSIAVYRDILYAARPGGVSRYDGSSWDRYTSWPCGPGKLVTDANRLYWADICGVPAMGLGSFFASWDGQEVRGFPPLFGRATAVGIYGGKLVVGVEQSMTVLRWNDSAWDSLGIGAGGDTTDTPRSFCEYNGGLVLGVGDHEET